MVMGGGWARAAPAAVPCVGMVVEDGNVDGMVNLGTGSMGVGGVSGMGVDGLVCARVMFGLPWAREVAFPRAFGTAFWGDDHTSLSRDSGHALVDAVKGLVVACWAWVSALTLVGIPGRPR